MPGSKYALIHWVNSNSTSIVPSLAVANPEQLLDPVKVGKISATILGRKEPVGGWTKHDGQVIQTDDKQSVLRSAEAEFIKENKSNEQEEHSGDEGRGRRKQKPKRFFEFEDDQDSESEVEATASASISSSSKPKSKKVKAAQYMLNDSILKEVKQRRQIQPQELECVNCSSLKLQVKELQKQNEVLCKGLPGVLHNLKEIVNKMTHKDISPRPTGASPERHRTTTTTTTMSPTTVNPSDIDLIPGVSIPAHVLKRCLHHDYKKLTRDLMCALFTREQMETCSVMGKKAIGAHASKTLRPCLPQEKVKGITYYVSKTFPKVELTHIRQLMAYKLKDVRAASSKSEVQDDL